MSGFRIACGAVCGIAATGFLMANTIILGRYGYRVGEDDSERIINAGVAGLVPVVLALMPFIVAITWKPGRWIERGHGRPAKWKRGRPSPIALIGFLLWGVFVFFNFMGAIGSIAYQRNEFSDKREGAIDDSKRQREARERATAELAKLKTDRPAATVRADLDATRLHKFWKTTNECAENEVTNKQQRNFCAEIGKLKGEFAQAERAEKLRDEIAELDRNLSSPNAKIASADPQSETLAAYANVLMRSKSVTAQNVRVFQPLVWFSLLELSCMFLGYTTLKFFRFSHTDLFDDEPAHVVPVSRHLPPPPPPKPPREPSEVRALLNALEPATLRTVDGKVGGEDPVMQRAVFDAFWAECVRHNAIGKTMEQEVFLHYRAYSSQRSTAPYDLQTFQRQMPQIQTTKIGQITYYIGLVLCDPPRGQ